MDFRGIVKDTTTAVQNLINYILALDISPEAKKNRIAGVYSSVGREFAKKTFEDASFLFDSTAIKSRVDINEEDQVERLATKVVRDSAFNLNDERITKEYYDTILGRSEHSAFQNAISLEKHPTLRRTIVGETCEWCEERAGVHTNPDASLFARHDNCDCLFMVSGYNSRNGRVNNYTKSSIQSKFTDQTGETVDWYERLRRVEAGEDPNNFIKQEE